MLLGFAPGTLQWAGRDTPVVERGSALCHRTLREVTIAPRFPIATKRRYDMRIARTIIAALAVAALTCATASIASAQETVLKLLTYETTTRGAQADLYIELYGEEGVQGQCVLEEENGELGLVEAPTDTARFQSRLASGRPNYVNCYNGAGFSGFFNKLELTSGGTATLRVATGTKLDFGECSYKVGDLTGSFSIPGSTEMMVTGGAQRTGASPKSCPKTQTIDAYVYLDNLYGESDYVEV